MIRNVETDDLERVRGFLEAHVDTSLFLLSNLAIFGPRLTDHGNSGNYRLVEEAGRVVAVFCLTRRGNLLVQILNGRVMSMLMDDDTANRKMDGLIGIQLHAGEPMKIEVRNIRLLTRAVQ